MNTEVTGSTHSPDVIHHRDVPLVDSVVPDLRVPLTPLEAAEIRFDGVLLGSGVYDRSALDEAYSSVVDLLFSGTNEDHGNGFRIAGERARQAALLARDKGDGLGYQQYLSRAAEYEELTNGFANQPTPWIARDPRDQAR